MRVNEDKWICDKLEELVAKYEYYLTLDEENELDEYAQGKQGELLAVVMDLKGLLYSKGGV